MKTALYDKHLALNARMVDFCGWEMPLQYKGILYEHQVVRNAVGLFDISHMGRIKVLGSEAQIFLEYISTNKIAAKPNLTAIYTPWANSEGYCVDDVIVYKKNEEDFFVIVNASNRKRDLDHLKSHSQGYSVQIQEEFLNEGILAVQGPRSMHLIQRIFPQALPSKFMHFQALEYQGLPIILSATGYTGEAGVEVYASNALIVELWDKFLSEGRDLGIEPIGLGARDTLRMEKGYALYGHELSETIAPTESVAAWAVHLEKSAFLGRSKLQELEVQSAKRCAYGILLSDAAIAREGCKVFVEDRFIGQVTSGGYSPTLKKPIAMVLVQGKYQIGDILHVEIRQKNIPAKIVSLPFL